MAFFSLLPKDGGVYFREARFVGEGGGGGVDYET